MAVKVRQSHNFYYRTTVALLIILSVSYVGFQVLETRAAPTVVSLEAENGTPIGNAFRLNDTTASNGSAAKFSQSAILLKESFDGPDGVFVNSADFWSSSDLGASKNSTWMSESGFMNRVGNTGTANDSMFRMWTRRTDMAYVKMEMNLKFNSFFSGDQSWHGVNIWLNESFCTPEQDINSCTKINDGNGPSGYAIDFMNRGGYIEILKKVKGDTRVKWPSGVSSYAAGGTYYKLASMNWSPNVGQFYLFSGLTKANIDGTTTIKLTINGQTLLEYTDNGSIGGPKLSGGRAGLRSDFANFNVDNIVLTSTR